MTLQTGSRSPAIDLADRNYAGALCTPTPAIDGELTAEHVLDVFHKSGARAVAVLLNGAFHGIITRDAWMDKFSGPYAMPLWGRLPANQFALPGLIVTSSLGLSEIARIALSRPEHERQQPLAVVDGGKYVGIIEYRALVEALLESRDDAMRAQLEAERGMQKLQRLESLGMLAGEVSHDFNNILASILGLVGIMKFSPMDDEMRESVAQVEQAARRGADITGRLLSFARGGIARFEPVDLVEVVRETLALAEPTLPRSVLRQISLPGSVVVEGNRIQLQQAVLNVILNARDAIGGEGTLSIRLSSDGDRAILTIADSGPGIDPAIQDRLFEPFFSTKPVGQGTGLGLAVSYGILRGHGGDIMCKSSRTEGAEFTLRVPLCRTLAPANPCSTREGTTGSRLMIVDDEAMLRRPTAMFLRNSGYNVVEMASGELAVAALHAEPDAFGLVLLDLVMPGMDGSTTFDALMRIRPGLPVIVWTGFAVSEHLPADMKRRVRALLHKPVAAEVLLANIERNMKAS